MPCRGVEIHLIGFPAPFQFFGNGQHRTQGNAAPGFAPVQDVRTVQQIQRSRCLVLRMFFRLEIDRYRFSDDLVRRRFTALGNLPSHFGERLAQIVLPRDQHIAARDPPQRIQVGMPAQRHGTADQRSAADPAADLLRNPIEIIRRYAVGKQHQMRSQHADPVPRVVRRLFVQFPQSQFQRSSDRGIALRTDREIAQTRLPQRTEFIQHAQIVAHAYARDIDHRIRQFRRLDRPEKIPHRTGQILHPAPPHAVRGVQHQHHRTMRHHIRQIKHFFLITLSIHRFVHHAVLHRFVHHSVHHFYLLFCLPVAVHKTITLSFSGRILRK